MSTRCLRFCSAASSSAAVRVMLVVGCVLMLELELRHGLHDVLDGRREIPVEFGRVTSLEESRDSQRR